MTIYIYIYTYIYKGLQTYRNTTKVLFYAKREKILRQCTDVHVYLWYMCCVHKMHKNIGNSRNSAVVKIVNSYTRLTTTIFKVSRMIQNYGRINIKNLILSTFTYL